MFIGTRSVHGYQVDIDDKLAITDFKKIAEINRDIGAVEFRLDKVFYHEELYKAYPELQYIPVHIEKTSASMTAIEGGWSSRLHRINISYGHFEELFSDNHEMSQKISGVILHELQHVIQQIEGLPAGSSPVHWINAVEKITKDSPEKLQHLVGIDGMVENSLLDDSAFKKISASAAFLEDAKNSFKEAEASGLFDGISDAVNYYGEAIGEAVLQSQRIERAINYVAYALYLQDPGEIQARNVASKYRGNQADPSPVIKVRELVGAPSIEKTFHDRVSNVRFALTRVMHQASQIPSAAMKVVVSSAKEAIDLVRKYSQSSKEKRQTTSPAEVAIIAVAEAKGAGPKVQAMIKQKMAVAISQLAARGVEIPTVKVYDAKADSLTNKTVIIKTDRPALLKPIPQPQIAPRR